MAEALGVDESDIPDNARQEDFSPWTSLAQLTLIVALEEEFGLTFSISEMTSMNSLVTIVEVLKRHGK